MPTIVRAEPKETEDRLNELGLSLTGLHEVLKAVFAEYGNCNENDPSGSHGLTVYRWGVRGLREQYRSQGWEIDRSGNLETIVNHDLKIRIAVMNSDNNTCDPDPDKFPQNRVKKGPNSERTALTNAAMLPGADIWPMIDRDGKSVATPEYTTWHLCIYIEGDELRAELSLLTEFSTGFFRNAHERLFLVKKDEWNPVPIETPDEVDNVDQIQEFPVEVTRKK